jgi:hypothetical protein
VSTIENKGIDVRKERIEKTLSYPFALVLIESPTMLFALQSKS